MDRWERQMAGLISFGAQDWSLRAGSNVLVAGTAIFGAKDPKQTIQEMRTAVDGAIAQQK